MAKRQRCDPRNPAKYFKRQCHHLVAHYEISVESNVLIFNIGSNGGISVLIGKFLVKYIMVTLV